MGNKMTLEEELGEEFCTAVKDKIGDKYTDIQRQLNQLMSCIKMNKDSKTVTEAVNSIENDLRRKGEDDPKISKSAKKLCDYWDVNDRVRKESIAEGHDIPSKVTTERDSLKRNDPPAKSSSDIDIIALINAIERFQKMDLYTLRRLLNTTVPSDSTYLQSGQYASPRSVSNKEWSTKYIDLKEQYDDLKNQIEDKHKLEDKLKDLTDQLKNMEQKSLEQAKEICLLQQRAKYGDGKLQECLKALEVKDKKLEAQAKEIKEVRKAKDDALTRNGTSAQEERDCLLLALEHLSHVRDPSDGNTEVNILRALDQIQSSVKKDSSANKGLFHAKEIVYMRMEMKRDWTNAKQESGYLFMALKCLFEHVRDLDEGKTGDDISSIMYQLGSSIDKESLASQGISHAIAISRIQMKMKSELDNVYGRISQFSTLLSGNEGGYVPQSNKEVNEKAASSSKERSIPLQAADQSQQALQFEKDVELIASTFNYLNEKKSELDSVYGRISQISTLLSGNEGGYLSPSNQEIDEKAATGRKERSIPLQATNHSQQALQFEEDVERITSTFWYLKEKKS